MLNSINTPPKRPQILLVDDEPDILEIVGYNLRNEGYQVFTATNGIEAVKSAKKNIPQLILLDIMMPKMDGWDTIAAIEDEGLYKGNVICMLTAVHDPCPKLEKLTEYVMDYVRKPFTSEELLEVVTEYIEYVQ